MPQTLKKRSKYKSDDTEAARTWIHNHRGMNSYEQQLNIGDTDMSIHSEYGIDPGENLSFYRYYSTYDEAGIKMKCELKAHTTPEQYMRRRGKNTENKYYRGQIWHQRSDHNDFIRSSQMENSKMVYYGWHLLLFSQIAPDKGLVYLDGVSISPADLIDFILFKKPPSWYVTTYLNFTEYFKDDLEGRSRITPGEREKRKFIEQQKKMKAMKEKT